MVGDVMAQSGDGVPSRGARIRLVWVGLLVVGLSGAAGCEKVTKLVDTLTGKTPSESPAATTEPAAPELPSRPIVADSAVVARVNGKSISRQDLELTIQELKATSQALGRPWTALSPDNKPDEYDLHDLLDELIIAELRVQDGLSYGLARDTDVQQRFWYRFRTFFAQEWVNKQLRQMTVGEDEVDQFYKQNQWGFREPEQLRIRQLMVGSEEQARTALVKLLEGGTDFTTIAQQISLRPEAAKSPLVDQWVMRSAEKAAYAPSDEKVRALLDPTLEQAAFAIDKAGGVSSYVKGADGNFHVFQLLERKAGRQRPLLEVADNIRDFLRLQKLAQKSDELRKKARVELIEDRLKEVQQ